MTDLSEIKYLPTDAVQSIAPAPAPKAVRKSRRPGTWIPLDYIQAFPGDHATYTLLAQLVYWRMPDDHGKSKLTIKDKAGNWVIAKNAAELLAETGLTRRQIDHAKASLIKLGIITAVSGARDATKTTFYSLVKFPGNSHLSDYPTIPELQTIALASATQCTCTCNASHLQVHSNTETVSETVAKSKKDVEEGGCKKPAATTPEKSSMQTGKNEPHNPKPGEVLHMAFRELQQIHKLPFPELGSPLHVRDCSSAEAIGHYLKLAELDEQQFAKWILAPTNWDELDDTVQPSMNCTPQVWYPKLGYLRTHLFAALTLYAQHLEIQKDEAQAMKAKFEQWAAEDAAAAAVKQKKPTGLLAKWKATEQTATPPTTAAQVEQATPSPTAYDGEESPAPLTPEQIRSWWCGEMAAREAEAAAKRKAILTAATNLPSKTKLVA